MKINGIDYSILDTFDNVVTIPDCFILGNNKIGTGHGEAKLYIGSKSAMHDFFGEVGFSAKCFLLKKDLITYLKLVKEEYTHPSQEYSKKTDFPSIWQQHCDHVGKLEDVVYFSVSDQTQIQGDRGYVNASRSELGYKLIRTITLPIISYLSIMKLQSPTGEILFYWKVFVDFELAAARNRSFLVLTYGKEKEGEKEEVKENVRSKEIRYARVGQGKYRDQLLEECPYCPITMVNDERILIASHIKPWAKSTDKEKIDPKNGYMLTPLYDALFDKGFITFTSDKRMLISNWLSPKNQQRLNLKSDEYIARLPMDDKREEYLRYHRENIFKG
uniref:HNH endonuclease n=1 Tax=Alistipes sp. TaxID=1872444 RepID=UPI004055ED82